MLKPFSGERGLLSLFAGAALILLSARPAQASVTFTCDTITFAADAPAGTCNTLNSTIAGFYSATFSNANASIYIEYGSTGLASSLPVRYQRVLQHLCHGVGQSPRRRPE